MAFCVHCGAKLSDGARFCGSCGARVASAAPVYTAPAAEMAPTETVYAAPIVEETPAEPAYAAPVVEEVPTEPAYAAPVVEEVPTEPAYAAPVVEEAPAEPAYAAPVAEEAPAEVTYTEPVAAEAPAESLYTIPDLPGSDAEPLYAAPITREHIRTSATPAAAQPMPFGNKSARGSSAAYSYATQERVSNPVKHGYVKPRRKFLAAFASVLICILLLTALLPTYLLITVRNTLQKETFLAIMHSIDMDKIPASVLDEYDEDLEDMSLAEALCEAINEEGDYAMDDWEDIDPEDLDAFIENSTFPEFIAETAEELLNFLISGKRSFSVSADDVEELLEANMDFLVELLGEPVTEQDLGELAEEIVYELGLEDLEMPDMDPEVRQALDILSIVLSFYAIGAVSLLLLLLVLLLFVANHRDPLYAIRDAGIVCLLGTILPLLMTLGSKIMVAAYAGKDAESYVASVVFSCVLESSLVAVAAIFGTGVVLLIINGIARSVQKKKALR